ncbi:alpha/beta hydrolase [Brenneria populi subsp. brevivirga]|uniref:alpha/beta fold hydrolase n=1 Tax=Brenneria populi TaxID=1505588 RepID=UPI002E16EA18|nr:alpha/beta hydrolase [Brenneria populi subsp. brevivirga]
MAVKIFPAAPPQVRRFLPVWEAKNWRRYAPGHQKKIAARRIELGLRLDIRAHLAAINVPTLVVALTQDTLIPRYRVEKVHSLIRNSEYAEIESGHAVQIENPDVWARTVRRFLDNATLRGHARS